MIFYIIFLNNFDNNRTLPIEPEQVKEAQQQQTVEQKRSPFKLCGKPFVLNPDQKGLFISISSLLVLLFILCQALILLFFFFFFFLSFSSLETFPSFSSSYYPLFFFFPYFYVLVVMYTQPPVPTTILTQKKKALLWKGRKVPFHGALVFERSESASHPASPEVCNSK
jgi:hypothetical protein